MHGLALCNSVMFYVDKLDTEPSEIMHIIIYSVQALTSVHIQEWYCVNIVNVFYVDTVIDPSETRMPKYFGNNARSS